MDLELTGKTALVLGGGGGLGSAICRSLAAEGASLAVADINKDAAEAVAGSISNDQMRAIALEWDLGDLDRIAPNIHEIEEAFGSVDILVALTGGPPPGGALGQATQIWQSQFNGMVLSVITICDHLVPMMTRRGWGRVITSTSSGVVAPIPNLAVSNSLRSALLGWSKSLASEVGGAGVTSNIIVPGRIATARTRALDEAKAKREQRAVHDVESASAASIPLGRYGRPEEYGDVVAFLASERASYINGSIIRVDGGYIPSI